MIRAAEAGKLDGYDKKDVAKYEAMAADFSRAVGVLPKYDGAIYRGLAFASSEKRNKFIDSLKDEAPLESSASFTSSEESALIFAGKGKEFGVVLSVADNKTAAPIDPFTKFKMEDEIIASKGTKYRQVSARKTDDGTIVVELEEL